MASGHFYQARVLCTLASPPKLSEIPGFSDPPLPIVATWPANQGRANARVRGDCLAGRTPGRDRTRPPRAHCGQRFTL